MTWLKTYGRVTLVCDDCTEPEAQRVEVLQGDETHHAASSRLWDKAVAEGWRSAAMGLMHNCTSCSGEAPW